MNAELNGIEVIVGALDLSQNLARFSGGHFYWTMIFDDVPEVAYRLLQADLYARFPVFITYPPRFDFCGITYRISQTMNGPTYNYQESTVFRLDFHLDGHFDFSLNFYFFAHPLDTYIKYGMS